VNSFPVDRVANMREFGSGRDRCDQDCRGGRGRGRGGRGYGAARIDVALERSVYIQGSS